MGPTNATVLKKIVWAFYKNSGRHDLPWRIPEKYGGFDPYKILVSEIMLQQTQVGRVIPKYAEFLERFPDVRTLARSDLGEVLREWNGLGYNRRAKYLWLAAQKIESDFGGKFPAEIKQLEMLPGVGANTSGAVVVYSFNIPTVFIETNIRTVFIHHFFNDQKDISDQEIKQLVEQTLDTKNPRQWYWALMDYGTYLKKSVGNLNRASKNYSKQTKFYGSLRQIRGQIIRELLEKPQTVDSLHELISDNRLDTVLGELVKEKMIHFTDGSYALE